MQKEPLVSVVVLTYNQEKYIAQTIECALSQKVDFDYEIVIGEDCSTDSTREICLRYQEKYPEIIRVITSDQNVGMLDNHYRSIKAATGKYIACCGGDDYWHNPEKLQRQVRFLEENPDYGMVHSDGDLLLEDEGRTIKNFNRVTEAYKCFENADEDILEQILSINYPILAGTATFRKRLFDDYWDLHEFKKNGWLMEDLPFWIEVAAHSKICYMDESFYTHREMRGTLSNPKSFDGLILFRQSAYNILLYYHAKYENIINNKELKKHIHYKYYQRTFRLALENKRPKLARDSYLNIVNLTGKSYLTAKDKLCYLLTYVPFGSQFYYFFNRFKRMQSK